jgi:hypothetical protein
MPSYYTLIHINHFKVDKEMLQYIQQKTCRRKKLDSFMDGCTNRQQCTTNEQQCDLCSNVSCNNVSCNKVLDKRKACGDDPSMELTHRVVHPKLTDATQTDVTQTDIGNPYTRYGNHPKLTDISQKIINNPYAHKDMDVQVITQKENVCKQQYCNNQKSSALQIVECKMFLQKFHNSCIMHHASCIMHHALCV